MHVELSSTSFPGKDEAFDVSSAGVSPALFFHAAETSDLLVLRRSKSHTSGWVSYIPRAAIYTQSFSFIFSPCSRQYDT
jgi:hypothetical protein